MSRALPLFLPFGVAQDFVQAPAYGANSTLRQVVNRCETVFGNLAIGRGGDGLLPGANDEKGDMVGWESREVGIKTEQLRPPRQFYAGFFKQFAREGGLNCFALFDPTARKMPAGPVSVAQEKDVVVRCQDDALRTHCQSSRLAPIELERSG